MAIVKRKVGCTEGQRDGRKEQKNLKQNKKTGHKQPVFLFAHRIKLNNLGRTCDYSVFKSLYSLPR